MHEVRDDTEVNKGPFLCNFLDTRSSVSLHAGGGRMHGVPGAILRVKRFSCMWQKRTYRGEGVEDDADWLTAIWGKGLKRQRQSSE